ncbi:MAG: hypothetical protein V4857_18085 [Pseudomonadota bacterium]
MLLGLVGMAHAADATLLDNIKAQRQALSIENGKLAGPGAASLRAAVGGSQFVFIGEDHGINEIAQFSSAWFDELAAGGYTTLATENGPAVAAAVRGALRSKDAPAAIAAYNREYPFSLAFYDLKPETEFLARVAQAAGPKFKLIGFDQELMGAAKYLLNQIAREPINAQAKTMVAAMQQRESATYKEAAASGNPGQLYMLAAKDEELAALRKLLTAPKEKPALALLDSLIESRSIYTKNMTGKGYESNLQRARLMKRNLAPYLAADPAQKMLVKVGALHAYRGYNALGSREIGNYLAEHADGRGTRSLHVLVLAPAGKQSGFAGIGRPPSANDVEPIGENHDFAGVLPLYAATAGESGWTLIDLRPMRQTKQALANPKFSSVAQGFDFALIIPVATAAPALP